MATHDEIIARWMKRNPKKNHLRGTLSFKDDVLLSRQLPIARILKSGEVLLSGRKNEYNNLPGPCTTPATSAHIAQVRRILSGERGYQHQKMINIDGTWSWKCTKIPDSPPWTVFRVFDVVSDPSDDEIVLAAGYIRVRLEDWLKNLCGWKWRCELNSARTKLEQAAALAARFKLDTAPLDGLKNLWEKATQHEAVYDFGGKVKLRRRHIDYNLPASTPVEVVAMLEAEQDPTVKAIKAAQAQQRYGLRRKLTEAV
jgi:hypothetical protein